jgi:hypothetical protein
MPSRRLAIFFAVAMSVTGVTVSLARKSPSISASDGTRSAAAEPLRRRTLIPVPNLDPSAVRQPARCRLWRVAVSADASTAFVTLAGKEISPGPEVFGIDVAQHLEVRRIRVGSYPLAIRLHPSGDPLSSLFSLLPCGEP